MTTAQTHTHLLLLPFHSTSLHTVFRRHLCSLISECPDAAQVHEVHPLPRLFSLPDSYFFRHQGVCRCRVMTATSTMAIMYLQRIE